MNLWSNFAALLTPRRLRAQALVLALCLWGICALDFATPGPFDHAGNIKFQDFLPFYISARLLAQGRSHQLFNQQIAFDQMHAILRESGDDRPTRVRLASVYGPQVGLCFVPLSRLSFPTAARLWIALSVILYFACIYLLLRISPRIRDHSAFIWLAAIAYPPLFHFFVRGQLSVLLLTCFTASALALHAKRNFLAGFALGILVFKPQFLVAIPIVLLLAGSWRALSGLILSAAVQLSLTWAIFGTSVMRAYFETLLHMSRWIETAEPGLARIQMHSLRSFWSLLLPWPKVALILYLMTSIVAILLAASAFKKSSNPALRFSALTLAAVLVNPHLFIYDLLVFIPVFLLLADWALQEADPQLQSTFRVLLYLAFVLPLFGPLSQWTHLQLSVPAFAALLWFLWTRFRASNLQPVARTQ